MVLKELYTANFIISLGFSFQTYVSRRDPRLVEFVWFEEPGIDSNQHFDVKIDEYFETTATNPEGDVENEQHNLSSILDDEAFAKYFFADKIRWCPWGAEHGVQACTDLRARPPIGASGIPNSFFLFNLHQSCLYLILHVCL